MNHYQQLILSKNHRLKYWPIIPRWHCLCVTAASILTIFDVKYPAIFWNLNLPCSHASPYHHSLVSQYSYCALTTTALFLNKIKCFVNHRSTLLMQVYYWVTLYDQRNKKLYMRAHKQIKFLSSILYCYWRLFYTILHFCKSYYEVSL